MVLSACNTGAGAVAGAEAASGLGRAFFYAGTRALLLTNWSVHSESARELITDLFKRQADNPRLTRGEALQQAMMSLVDGPGFVGTDGKTDFTYAHPAVLGALFRRRRWRQAIILSRERRTFRRFGGNRGHPALDQDILRHAEFRKPSWPRRNSARPPL